MKKVLSCKIEHEIYDLIDKLSESHSDILRRAIKEYIQNHINKSKK